MDCWISRKAELRNIKKYISVYIRSESVRCGVSEEAKNVIYKSIIPRLRINLIDNTAIFAIAVYVNRLCVDLFHSFSFSSRLYVFIL